MFLHGSALTNKGLRSRSSRLGEPLLTCLSKSVLPIISLSVLNPNAASISLTSSEINLNKFTTLSGVPVNFFHKSSSCVQTPTGHVFE